MLTISFVCLGNICRSPMAEAVCKKLAEERGMSSALNIQSFATSSYESGNPVYPPAAHTLRLHKIYGFTHRSRQLTLSDIKNSDYVLVMDGMNLSEVNRLSGGAYNNIMLLGGFLQPKQEIADPYYTHDFEKSFTQIYEACSAFLEFLLANHPAVFSGS